MNRKFAVKFTGFKNAALAILLAFIVTGSATAQETDVRLPTEPINLDNISRLSQIALLGEPNDVAVHSLAFSPDGSTLAFGTGQSWGIPGSVHIWDVATRTERTILRGHTEWVQSLVYSPDGLLLASGSGDRTVRLWDPETGDLLHVLEGLSDSVSGFVTYTDDDGTVTRSELFSDAIWDIAISPDGSMLAVGRGDPFMVPGSFQLYDVPTGALLADVRPQHSRVPTEVAGVSSLSFRPDGTFLVTANGDCTVRLWDMPDVQEHILPRETPGCITSVAFSSDGTMLALSGSGGGSWGVGQSREFAVLELWDGAAEHPVAALEGNEEGIAVTAFSPDGTVLASGDRNGSVRFWDVTTATLLVVADAPPMEDVACIAFSPDGTLLAAGGVDGTVRLWGIPPE
jgi:WD40 repeat protein